MRRPALVVVHGSGVTSAEYARLATALVDRFTVHRYDRRGRAGAPPQEAGHTVEDDVDDLVAVLRRTGASLVLGHSYGGLVALRAALRPAVPVARIAVYDGAIGVDGLFPGAFLDECEQAVRAGDRALALARVNRGLRAAGPLSSMPVGAQARLLQLFLRTRIGRQMGELLPSALREARQVQAHDGPADRYAALGVPLLLATGAWSPPYYGLIHAALARAVPDGRALTVARAGHDGPNRAPRRVTEPIAAFLAASTSCQHSGGTGL